MGADSATWKRKCIKAEEFFNEASATLVEKDKEIRRLQDKQILLERQVKELFAQVQAKESALEAYRKRCKSLAQELLQIP